MPKLGVVLEESDAKISGVFELSIFDQMVEIAATNLKSKLDKFEILERTSKHRLNGVRLRG